MIGLVIHNAGDKDVDGETIKMSATPEGQAWTDVPVIKHKGDRLYTVSNSNLKKGSKWELRIGVNKAVFEDIASSFSQMF